MMAQERKVRVFRSAESLIEEDFGSIHERFDVEMAKMAEEMARFRSNLVVGETQYQTRKCQSSHSKSSYCSSTTTSTSSSTTAIDNNNKKEEQVAGKSNNEEGLTERNQRKSRKKKPDSSWLDSLNSPLIKDSDEGRILSIRFDVRPYEPEQIVVKTVDNLLMVHAEMEQNEPQSSVHREYNREFLLPRGTKLDFIRSSLSADGVLTVEAPLP